MILFWFDLTYLPNQPKTNPISTLKLYLHKFPCYIVFYNIDFFSICKMIEDKTNTTQQPEKEKQQYMFWTVSATA